MSVHSFALGEIQEAFSIVYEHDDSETKEDSFQIQLTDGHYIVEQNVPIMVILVDEETSRMAINNGLEVEIGKSCLVKPLKPQTSLQRTRPLFMSSIWYPCRVSYST